MLDTMRRAQYFKVQVPNKPGEAARFLGVLEAAHLNLLAFLAFPRNRRWQMDFVPDDPSAFKATVTRAGWKIQGPKTCFLVEMARSSRVTRPFGSSFIAARSHDE